MKQRIRSIKPEAFSSAKLWDVEAQHPHAFRVFAGLWTIADREGRFEWKPREIGALLMPYHQAPVLAALDALVSAGMVARYKVDGREYAVLPSFLEHQVPNAREPVSRIPAPLSDDHPLSPEPPHRDGRTCAHVHARAGTSPVHETDAPVHDSDAPVHETDARGTCRKVSSGKGREGKGEEAGLSLVRTLDTGGVVSGVTLRDFIRGGVIQGYQTLKLPPPRETRDLTWRGWHELEHWTVAKAGLLSWDQHETARHLIRCFLRSAGAKRRGWPIKFLVENANEYWRDELPAEVA